MAYSDRLYTRLNPTLISYKPILFAYSLSSAIWNSFSFTLGINIRSSSRFSQILDMKISIFKFR